VWSGCVRDQIETEDLPGVALQDGTTADSFRVVSSGRMKSVLGRNSVKISG
jgi:hypothetical protein